MELRQPWCGLCGNVEERSYETLEKDITLGIILVLQVEMAVKL